MDRLWSPWRYRYVSAQTSEAGCIFCDKAASPDDDAANYILHRARHNFVLLNLFPYTSGHLMIAPYEHVASLAEASIEAVMEMMRLAQRAEVLIRQAYRPDGLNLGMNLGQAAGAGVAGHIHLHALPRWSGDANFMTAVGETRVIPEDIVETYRKLKDGWS